MYSAMKRNGAGIACAPFDSFMALRISSSGKNRKSITFCMSAIAVANPASAMNVQASAVTNVDRIGGLRRRSRVPKSRGSCALTGGW